MSVSASPVIFQYKTALPKQDYECVTLQIPELLRGSHKVSVLCPMQPLHLELTLQRRLQTYMSYICTYRKFGRIKPIIINHSWDMQFLMKELRLMESRAKSVSIKGTEMQPSGR